MRAAAIAIVISSAVVVSGCSGSGAHQSPANGSSRSGSPASTSAGSAVRLPSGFASDAAWTTHLTWSRSDLIQTGVPARPEDGIHFQPPAGFALVAMAGDTLVTADFSKPNQSEFTPVTLEFRNVRTGAVVAQKHLETYNFAGMRSDTVHGKPVVEVRYSPTQGQPGGSTDGSNFISVVFDTSGNQLWTSAGQLETNYLKPGLLFASTGLVSHGYLLWFDPGTNNWHEGGRYDVLDLSGKVVMSVPYHPVYYRTSPMQSPVQSVQLINGYAVVIHPDNPPATAPPFVYNTPSGTPERFRFTVYNLEHGGKPVADVPESFHTVDQNVYSAAGVAAGCGGKLLLTWNTGSMRDHGAAIQTSVLNLATGRTTTPVAVPVTLRAQFATLTPLTDAACSTALLSGTTSGGTLSFAVDLTTGTVLWQNADADHDLSMRTGRIFALRSRALPPPVPGMAPTLLPGSLLTISATDGSTQNGDPAAVPLAFAADGAPVFAVTSDPTTCSPPPPPAPTSTPTSRPTGGAYTSVKPLPELCAITLWVGRS